MHYDSRDWNAQIEAVYGEQWDTFATFKFCSGYSIKRDDAQSILLKTWNIIDRAYFGICGVKRGVRGGCPALC